MSEPEGPDGDIPLGGRPIPSTVVLGRVVRALEAGGVTVALGGSGLLAGLGLVDRVRDWDLTTDDDPQRVRDLLVAAGLPVREQEAGDGGYATGARLQVDGGDHEIELIVGFAVQDGDRRVPLPTRVTGRWRGIPLGDPEVWAVAYRLIGRPQRAAVLQHWLDARSAAANSPGDASPAGSSPGSTPPDQEEPRS